MVRVTPWLGLHICETFTLTLTTTLAGIHKGARIEATAGQVESSRPTQEGQGKTRGVGAQRAQVNTSGEEQAIEVPKKRQGI